MPEGTLTELKNTTIKPVYVGDDLEKDGNYGPGYIGFTYTDSIISEGITYFTRWDRLSDIKVNHALVVINEQECVEALMGSGVVRSPLSRYFENNKTQIFFRKPKEMTHPLAQGIIDIAQQQVHKHYDNNLIFADLIAGSFFGHLLNRFTHNAFVDELCQWFDDHQGWICSELAAFSLWKQESWLFHNQGILKNPINTINPQALFEDKTIFSEWHKPN